MYNLMLKLNVGSGQRKFATPWCNVDINPKWEPDVVADCASGDMPFDDASADMIVLSHCLEHFGCGEAADLLKECRRVLCVGGSLIVTVPDMLALSHGWAQGRIDTQVYLTNVYGAYMDDEADRHKFGYTFSSLWRFLYEQGFNAGKFDWRKIEGADIARDWWILGVEAIR